MLYQQWQEIARERPDEWALRDLTSGRLFTFGQLAEAAANMPRDDAPVIFPQGHSAEFVLAVLRAWRDARVVCPLEASDSAFASRSLIIPALRDTASEGGPATPFPAGCAHLKMTSATTSSPRVVAFTAEQLAADAGNIVATMGLRPDWPNLGVISLAHSYGFSNLILPLLLHGIPLVLGRSPLPEVLREASGHAGHITLPAVPALWRTWHEANVIPGHVRLAISAGAPLPVPLEQGVFAARGLKIHNFYGSSECGGIAYDDSPVPRTDETCVGRPLRDVELAVGANGCLEVRSRAVGQGYWPEPDDSLGSGRFKTNDLAELKDGFVCLRGRAGDQINVAGRKVSPHTIEETLRTHPALRDCLVFGVPGQDAGRGESIVACVVAEGEVSVEALKQFLLEKLPAWQVPREWLFLEALPANERGKISRAEWRRRYPELKGRID